MTQTEIEERLIALETELRLLKAQRVVGPNKADPKWVLAHAGRFADDPGFAEIVRLGQAYRKSLDAKPKKPKKPPPARKPTHGMTFQHYPKKPTATRKPKAPVKNGRA